MFRSKTKKKPAAPEQSVSYMNFKGFRNIDLVCYAWRGRGELRKEFIYGIKCLLSIIREKQHVSV